jgi:hypothetical protein
LALAAIKNALRPNRARSLTPSIKDRLRLGWWKKLDSRHKHKERIHSVDVPSFLSILFVLNVGRYKT